MSQQFPIERGTRAPLPAVATEGQRDFGFPYWLYAGEDVQVRLKLPGDAIFGPPLVFGFDFDVSGLNQAGGATITLAVGVPAGTEVDRIGLRQPERTTSVMAGGSVRSGPLERELDLLNVIAQELRRDTDAAGGKLDAISDTVAEAVADSAASASLAEEWAEKPYGQPISGEPAGRSARHFSVISQQFASEAAAYAGAVGGLIFDFGAITEGISGEEDWGMI